MTIFFKNNWGVLIVLLLSFWAIRPLFIAGFFPMHDDTQVARVFEMGKMLKEGTFPVRWVPDLGYGYGYPIFNFYAPLAYYVGGFFNVLGFDALTSTKIMMILGILFSGVFMYFLARGFWGELGGIVSGLFYLYAPFHAVDIYVRGDVAEFWAYAFIPLMFWGFYKVFDSPRRSPSATFEVGTIWKWVIVGSVGYAGVILSHNLTAIMVSPFLVAFILFCSYFAFKNKKLLTFYFLLFTSFLGLTLSAFYWIPALLEMGHTNVLSQIGGGADFRDHFVCLSQLWNSQWGFGGSIPGCIDGLSFRIGKLHILSILISLAVVVYYTFRHSGKPKAHPESLARGDSGQARMTGFEISSGVPIFIFSIAGFITSIFFMLDVSRPVWELLKPMEFFQYPWRFLILASFFSSLLAGFVIWFLNIHLGGAEVVASSPPRWAISTAGFVVLLFLLIYPNSKLFQPQTILSKNSSDYTNEIALKWTASKTSDEFLPPNFKKPKSESEVAKGLVIAPDETYTQKLANAISFTGILIVAAGIIVGNKKRLRA